MNGRSWMQGLRASLCLLTVVALAGVGAAVQADGPSAGPEEISITPGGEFPGYPEVEYERSVIRIPLRFGNDTEPREIVELTAFMKLEREAPVRNTIGYRQFEFTIREWELFGYSEVLGAHLSFAASMEAVQPKSLCVALQKEADYPALIVYNAIYDIYLDGRKLVSQRPGVAMARGVVEIPPRNITVAFQKPFAAHRPEFEMAEKQHGDCNENPWDYRCWVLDPGTCEDMTTISQAEFEAGIQEARAIREQLATLKPKKPAAKAGETKAGAP